MNKTKITAEEGKLELFIEREFDAPRELVFKAHTDPELYVQWLGPKGYEMKLETFEPKSGGSYRYTHFGTEEDEYKFHGVYHMVTPEVIIQTFEYEGMPEPGHVAFETLRLEELPGDRTKLVAQSIFQSVEDRDGMIQSGMEKGVVDGYERLDDVLSKMK